MKCRNCGHWNRVEVNEIFIEQPTIEPKAMSYIQCTTMKTETREKCKSAKAESNELIRIVKENSIMKNEARTLCNYLSKLVAIFRILTFHIGAYIGKQFLPSSIR
jgi:hypothetical protein